MARQRSPQSIEAERMYKDEKMLLVDIAAKLGVPASTVRRWKSDQDWDGKKAEAAKKNKPSARKKSDDEKPSARKPRGAPKGNRNAVGNSGGPGGPPGNSHALKHGGYAAIFFDTLDEEEKKMIDGMEEQGHTEEQMLIDEIDLLTVRERRIMKSIARYKSMEETHKGQAVSSIITSEDKRRFASPDEEELYKERVQAKVSSGDRMPGQTYHITTTTEATYDIIQRLEEALTRCQAQKQRCIDSLCKVRQTYKGTGKNEVVDDWISGVLGGAEIE